MSLAGAVVWGVIPFVPESPFHLYAGTDHAPIDVPGAGPLINDAQRGGDRQFSFIVQGKARPVLILTDTHSDDLREYLALRLARFTKLTKAEQQNIRDGKHPALFHLKPETFDLPEENAAMLDSLVRVHASAINASPCGRLNIYELQTLQERFLRFHGFDLRGLMSVALQQFESRGRTS